MGVVDVPDKLPTTLSDLSDEQDLSYPTVWMDLGSDEDIYLARVNWMCDGRLSAQIENRLQTELQLQTYDIESGKAHLLLQEVNDTWINLHNLFTTFIVLAKKTKSLLYIFFGVRSVQVS